MRNGRRGELGFLHPPQNYSSYGVDYLSPWISLPYSCEETLDSLHLQRREVAQLPPSRCPRVWVAYPPAPGASSRWSVPLRHFGFQSPLWSLNERPTGSAAPVRTGGKTKQGPSDLVEWMKGGSYSARQF